MTSGLSDNSRLPGGNCDKVAKGGQGDAGGKRVRVSRQAAGVGETRDTHKMGRTTLPAVSPKTFLKKRAAVSVPEFRSSASGMALKEKRGVSLDLI